MYDALDIKTIYAILISEIKGSFNNYKIYKLDPEYIIRGWV